MAQDKIDAVDIFDWDHLVQIGAYLDGNKILTLDDAIRVFAYAFTSTASADEQDRLLAEWIQRATYLQSAETSEAVLAALANYTNGNLELLRKFARQNGIRLKRG